MAMNKSNIFLALIGTFVANLSVAQDPETLKSAVVGLAAQPELRSEFETGLVAKARELSYDAITSFDIVPDVTHVDDADFIERLSAEGVGAILVVRPAIRDHLGLPPL
ncbi:MAG: hypothetical protein ACJ0SL_02315 [Candidatus Rariloculaceae bacterium]